MLRSLGLVTLEPFFLPSGAQVFQRTLSIGEEPLATHELLEPAVGAVGGDEELWLCACAFLGSWLELGVLGVVVTDTILFSALLQLVGYSVGVAPCRLATLLLSTSFIPLPLLRRTCVFYYFTFAHLVAVLKVVVFWQQLLIFEYLRMYA